MGVFLLKNGLLSSVAPPPIYGMLFAATVDFVKKAEVAWNPQSRLI
jgi:hypothetical protein